jgi:hypothetical protein
VVQGEQIDGRQIIVTRVTANQPLDACALLFVPASADEESWLSLAAAHTLTVGESNDFLRRGGIIKLTVDAGRVRFDVNLDAAAAHEIQLSSHLLRLARQTVRGPL